jgi:hypothetical protein
VCSPACAAPASIGPGSAPALATGVGHVVRSQLLRVQLEVALALRRADRLGRRRADTMPDNPPGGKVDVGLRHVVAVV